MLTKKNFNKMKNIKNIFLIVVTFTFLFNCEENYVPEPLNYVTFSENSYSTGVDVSGTTTVDLIIFSGNVVNSERTFAVSVDGSNAPNGSYSVPSSFSIPGGTNEGILSVSLSDVNLGIGISKINISIDQEAGLSVGDPIVVSYYQNCNEVTGTLDLTFDRWGSEVSWDIKDELGGLVLSGGGYPDTGSGTSTSDTINITLCAGRLYTFTAYDSYGDGWGAVGSYTLTIGGVVKASGNGTLGGDYSSETTEFDTN